MRKTRYCRACACNHDAGQQWVPVGTEKCDFCEDVAPCYVEADVAPIGGIAAKGLELARLVVEWHELPGRHDGDFPPMILNKAREILREGE